MIKISKTPPMYLTLIGLCLVLALSWSAPTRVHAQQLYGAILGNVVDVTGGAIPGAEVTVVNNATNYTQTSITNDVGSYSLLNVPRGGYTLTVSLTGFREYVALNVVVTVGDATRENVTLQVGEITERVTVSAAATVLQTDTTDVHAQMEAREIADLPLSKYRNYQSLLNLVPGATPGRFQNAVIDTPGRALTTNINGTNRNTNNTRIDGAISVNIWLPHHTAYTPPAETIEEVNISTNNFDAEQGFAGGAAVTLISKTGTNDFHGTVFALHENNAANAREFFTVDKPGSIRNIDGVTIGGPIQKDKLFFFFGYESNRDRLGITQTHTIATLDQRAGDFSAFLPGNPFGNKETIIYDPLTGDPADGSGRTPFPNNIIPDSRKSQPALRMQSRMPPPTFPGLTSNFQRSGTQKFNRDNFDSKVDWYRTDDHRIFGKFSDMEALVSAGFVFGDGGGPGLSTAGSGDGDTSVRVYGVGHNWTLSPTFLIDGNFGWTDMHQEVLPPDFELGNFAQEVLGIPGTNKTDERSCPEQRCSGMPRFDVSGFQSFGNRDGWSPIFRDERSATFTQNFSWSKGDHELRWGYDVVKHLLDHWQPEIGGGPRGRFRFFRAMTTVPGSSETDQNAYAAYLLGLPLVMQKSLQWELMTTREWQHAFYFRDRWQATPKLTFTLGLRYEYFPLITRADRPMERLDFSTMQVHLDNDIDVSKSLFAPRIGFAYRITDNDVIRTGYGITNSPIPFGRPLRGFYPLTIAGSFDAEHARDPFRTLDQGIPLFLGPDVSPGAVLDLPPTVDMRSMPSDKITRGYIQSWNAIYERKLPAEFVASAGYVGTQVVHQLADHNINWSPPGGGTPGRQLFAQFGGRSATTRFWNGFLQSNYHSLQVAINRRFTGGLFVKGAYTFSHAINMTDDEGWAGLTWNDTSILRRNRANAGYNIPHILQLATLYELPFGQDGDEIGDMLIRGWQINSIFSVNQQRQFRVRASGGTLQAPGNSQTADQVGAVRQLGGIGRGNPYYDRGAFEPPQISCPPDCRYGTSGRNILRGPTWVNWDFSLFRRFGLTEDVNLEFRVESFNFTNTPKFNNPNSNSNSSGFFDITSTSGNSNPRLWRFGLKLVF